MYSDMLHSTCFTVHWCTFGNSCKLHVMYSETCHCTMKHVTVQWNMSLYNETCHCTVKHVSAAPCYTHTRAQRFLTWELHHVHIITVDITADRCGRIELVSVMPGKPNSPWPCYQKHFPSFWPPTKTNQIIKKSKLLSAQHRGPKIGFISGKGGTDAPNRLFMQGVELCLLFFFLPIRLTLLKVFQSSRSKYNASTINYLLIFFFFYSST